MLKKTTVVKLRIYLLGEFQIWRNDHFITPHEWPTQKVKSLLQILLTERNRVVPSDQLIEWLWPRVLPNSALKSLHTTVSRLRHVLEPRVKPPVGSHFIITRHPGYTFDPAGRCQIDVDEFLARTEEGKRSEQRGELGPAIAAYTAAEKLYRGDYLEEEIYEDWSIATREQLRETYFDLLSNLARCYAQQGRYRQALVRCHKILARDPCQEGVWRQVMTYYYYAGEKAQALRAFERCREILAEELNVDPMPQTQELHRRILCGEVEPPVTVTEIAPPLLRTPTVIPPQLMLVGRDKEWNELSAHLEKAISGQGRVVFISGETGVGKTRLLNDFTAAAQGRGVRVLSGYCYELERDLPFQPLVELLRRYILKEAEPEELRSALGRWASPVAVLVPLVQDLLGELPPYFPLPPEEERLRILEGLANLLTSLSMPAPLILSLDDLHWADDSTLQFLHYLTRKIAQSKVLILGCYRPEEVFGKHPLLALRQALRKGDLLWEITLLPLSLEDVAYLVREMSQFEGSAALFAQRLYEETEGNPFFIAETIRSLFEESLLLVGERGKWSTNYDEITENYRELMLPLTVKEAILDRCHRLDEKEQQLLGTAAVIGQRYDTRVLSQVSRVKEGALLDTLDGLLERHLVREISAEEYEFTHHKIRETLYQDLTVARRRALHRRVAKAMERLSAERPTEEAAILAHHFLAGDLEEKAVEYLIKAGETAEQRYAHEEAVTHYSRALEIIPRVTLERANQLSVTAYRHRGRVRISQGKFDEARDDFLSMLEKAKEMQDKTAQAEAHCNLAWLLWNLYQLDSSLDESEQALTLAKSVQDKPCEARSLSTKAMVYLSLGRLSEASCNIVDSLAIGKKLEDKGLQVENLWGLGGIRLWEGDCNEALSLLKEGLDLCNEPRYAFWMGGHLFFIAMALASLGQYGQALATLDEAADAAEVTGVEYWSPRLFNTRGWIYQELWALREALSLNKKGVKAGYETGQIEVETNSLVNLATDYRLLGKYRQSLECLQASEDLVKREDWCSFRCRTRWLWNLGELSLAEGDHKKALHLAEDTLKLAMGTGQKKNMAKGWKLKGEALAMAGKLNEAVSELEKAIKMAEEIAHPNLVWQICHSLAQLCERQGRPLEAKKHYEKAIRTIEEIASEIADKKLSNSFTRAKSVLTIYEGLARLR